MNKINLTESMQDYIEAIYIVLRKKPVCRVNDIRELLNVSKASIVHALSILKEKKLIEKEKYGYITLTKKGKNIAEEYYKKHMAIKLFLEKLFSASENEADEIACGIEHHLEKKYIDKINNIIKSLENNPELLEQLTGRKK